MGRKPKKSQIEKKKKEKTEDDILSRYGDLSKPGAFSNPEKLAKHYNKKREIIADALKSDPSYYLYKKVSNNFLRRRVLVNHPNYLLAIDLKDVREYGSKNRNIGYLLCAIDCFSRFGYCQPMINKNASSCEKALSKILNQMKPPCRKIWADRGSEFYNRSVSKLLKSKNIVLFSTQNYDIKSSIVERWQRTLLRMINKYMERNNTENYVNDLQQIVDNYNNTFHRAIKMSPNQVKDENVGIVLDNLYHSGYSPFPSKIKHRAEPKFKIGDTVVVTKLKKLFDKEYRGTYVPEIYFIHEVSSRNPCTYKVRDIHFFTRENNWDCVFLCYGKVEKLLIFLLYVLDQRLL